MQLVERLDAPGIVPRRLSRPCGASVVTARDAVANRTEIPMKLTDTQLVLLSAASQREDYGIELAPKLKGGAAHKVVGKDSVEPLLIHRTPYYEVILCGQP